MKQSKALQVNDTHSHCLQIYMHFHKICYEDMLISSEDPIFDIFSSKDSQVETLMSLSVPKTPSLTSLRSS